MNTRSVVTVSLVGAVILLAGCGPTSTGLKRRDEARARLDGINAQFTFEQARQEFEVGQFDRAIKTIDLAIAQSPEEPKFHVLKGRINLEQHLLERALKSFNDAAEIDPEHAEAHYFAGIVHQRWSNDQEAYASYARAFEIEPSNVQYLTASAESLIALGEFAQAETLVEGRLGYFEHNAALRQLLGQIALLQNDPVRAAQLYDEARLLNPDDNVLIEELAWAQFEAAQYGPCYETLQFLRTRIKEERNDLRHLEARCLIMMGRSADAHSIYLDLTQRQTGSASLWIEFGTLAWELGDTRRVAQCSVRAIALAPERFEGYMLKGLYERHQGRQDEAIRLLQQAASRTTDSSLPYVLLAQSLDEAGRLSEALAAYEGALEIDPHNQTASAGLQEMADAVELATVTE